MQGHSFRAGDLFRAAPSGQATYSGPPHQGRRPIQARPIRAGDLFRAAPSGQTPCSGTAHQGKRRIQGRVPGRTPYSGTRTRANTLFRAIDLFRGQEWIYSGPFRAIQGYSGLSPGAPSRSLPSSQYFWANAKAVLKAAPQGLFGVKT